VNPVPVFRNIMAQPLMWLMLITKAMGMCLMNGYSIFKGQTRPLLQKRTGEGFYPFTCFLTKP
jgi:hypothetical protein